MMEWNHDDLMVAAAAATIKDGDVVLVGTGIPLVAAYFAKLSHAPNITMVFESGAVDAFPEHLAIGPGDFPLISGSAYTTSLFEALSYVQRGKIDVGFLGGAEIDQFGNINTTVIGPYKTPKVRLPGSGGANDIASHAKKTVIIAKHQKRHFPKKVEYITSPGFLDGPGTRDSYGLKGQGPYRIITDFGVFGFDDETKRVKILSIHPGVSKQQIINNTQFEILGIDKDITLTKIPDEDALSIIHGIDPDHIYIGKK